MEKVLLVKKKIAYLSLIFLGVIALIGAYVLSPIKQDLSYHGFCDDITFFKINNFWNTISNLPFLVVGILGLYKMRVIANGKIQYTVFFIGIVLIAIGSSYYHLNPNNYTLIFDRLPMTILFMSLLSIIVSEFINNKVGQKLLLPILSIGLISIIYWIQFDDLSLYALVQFYPMFAIPIILISFKPSYTKTYGYWLLLLFYILAKLCEHFDDEIFSLLKVISGHSLKHVISALGLYILFRTFIKREKLKPVIELNK